MTAPPVIWHCPLCGKVGDSPADLTRQGCEGMHVKYVRADDRHLSLVKPELPDEAA